MQRVEDRLFDVPTVSGQAGKPGNEKPRQRSLIVLEIKPSEVEIDLDAMAIRIKAEISHLGIQNWGPEHKLVPIGYGIQKLLINLVVYDDGIDVDTIETMIYDLFPGEIQSIDIYAMSKV